MLIKIGTLVKNLNFTQKLTFWRKIEIGEKMKCMPKIRQQIALMKIVAKNR